MLSKVERQNAVKPILLKLKELRLTPTSYESIKTLYQKLQVYINQGERTELNIPFPEYNVTIKGLLDVNKVERVWVKLEHNKDSTADSN